MRDQRGFTLIEAMFGGALLAVTLAIILTLSAKLQSSVVQTRDGKAASRLVREIYESVRGRVGQGIADYHRQTTNQTMAQLQSLPLTWAWSAGRLVPVAQCRECPGKVGYLVQPLADYPGLYSIVIRVTHPDLFAGAQGQVFRTIVREP